MTFCIQLGDNVRLSPKSYLAALRMAMAELAAEFRQSFNDPRGWTGPHTGASIVQEWRDMLAERWADKSTRGKGNRARKRADALRCCRWCGTQCGKDFCDVYCRHDYYF